MSKNKVQQLESDKADGIIGRLKAEIEKLKDELRGGKQSDSYARFASLEIDEIKIPDIFGIGDSGHDDEMRQKKSIIASLKKELAAIKKEVDKARERKREKEQRQRMDRYRGHSIDPAQQASIDRQRQADPYSRFANVEIDEAKSPSLKVRIGENKNRNKNQMNKSNLQVFIETSEKIASERKQRLDEIFGDVDVTVGDGKVKFSTDGIGVSENEKQVLISYGAFYAAIAITALITLPAWAMLPGLAFAYYKYRKKRQLIGKFLDKFMKKFFPQIADQVANFDRTPGEQFQQFINKLGIKLSEEGEMSEEEIDTFIGLVINSIAKDERVRQLGDEMTELLASEENDEMRIASLTVEYDKAMKDVLKRLLEEAKANAEKNAEQEPEEELEQEPEEELAMVAESKQYDRWKVIAGVENEN